MTGLKMVKGAHLTRSDGLNTIEHYDTVIFTYDESTGRAWCLKNCSMTSNRQIRFAIAWFQPKETKEELNSEKWEYSRPIDQ